MIRPGESFEPYIVFSKVFSDELNPKSNFCAVMVCSNADEGCPFVPGAEKRISLLYEDPKIYDGTELETVKYDERCYEIGRDIMFMMKLVNEKNR